jgi:hypothetical protein
VSAGTPAVSVVVPSFNGLPYLREAVASILGQTLEAIELVLVDDGSTDETAAYVATIDDPRLRYLSQQNRGLAASRNVGIRAARAAYVAFLDHDDRYAPDKLARQAAVLDARPDVGVVYTGWRHIDGDGRVMQRTGWDRIDGDILPTLILGNVMHPSTMMVRREPVVAAGAFDESRTGLEDWDLWVRLATVGVRWACVDAPLVDYRLHPGQMSKHGARRRLDNRLAILDRTFAAPDLAENVRRLEADAYQNAFLMGAADYHRAGQADEARAAFRAAVARRPVILTEPRRLRGFCRSLNPMGAQHVATTASHWRSVGSTLRGFVRDAVQHSDASPEVRHLAARARWATFRTVATLARRGTRAAIMGSRRKG